MTAPRRFPTRAAALAWANRHGPMAWPHADAHGTWLLVTAFSDRPGVYAVVDTTRCVRLDD